MFRLLRPIFGNKPRIASVIRKLCVTQSVSHLSNQAGYERNIVESRYGPVDIPKMCLTDYIFQGHEKVAEKPALVSMMNSSEKVVIDCVKGSYLGGADKNMLHADAVNIKT